MGRPTTRDVRDALWRTLRLHARLPVFQRRLDEARATIARARERGPVAVCVSGGKDSMAAWAIAREVEATIPGVWFDTGCDTDATHAVFADMAAGGWPVTRVAPAQTVVDMLQAIGWCGYQGPNRTTPDGYWLPHDYVDILLREPAQRVRADLTAADAAQRPAVLVLGLRADESRGRRHSARRRGDLYDTADGPTACPLVWWTGRDVLAYLVTRDLPISREYLRADDTLDERVWRRTGMAVCVTGVWRGSWARLRREEPATWARLVTLFPEMAREA